jgi:aminoglycoside phosphotransferase (APT) family kinase protein
MTRMHRDEVDIDISLVRRLVATQFPQWSSLSIEPVLPLGTDNALFKLGDELIARLPRRGRTSHTLEKELHWLPKLATHLPVAIPIPKAVGTPAEDHPFPWSVYTWLKGENPTIDRVTDLNTLATDLVHFIAALQGIDPAGGPSPGAHNFYRGVPLKMRDEMTRAAIASLGSTVDRDLVTAVWETALQAPEWNREAVWIHGDLDSRNILVERGRLSGVIDFGGLGLGDPACDVMLAWKLLSPDARDIFRTALSVDGPTWIRSRGWALSQALVALSYYTEETNPTLVLEARRWITEILSDAVSITTL